MDNQKFQAACEQVLHTERGQNGIGSLGEKTLHLVLKHYFAPDIAVHEKKVGGFVADLVLESGIIEIQTRNFDKLRKKLEAFLALGPVTVVYPIARTKWLSWLDTENGAITPKRKSPKQGSVYDMFFELYKIRPFLNHPNFRLCVVLLDVMEYRHLNGWSKDKKKGSSRFERIPVELADEIYFCNVRDYQKLVPYAPEKAFTSKDFKEAVKTSLKNAQLALQILHDVKAVKRIGKAGNAYIYKIA